MFTACAPCFGVSKADLQQAIQGSVPLRLALRPGGRPGSISWNRVRDALREDRGVAALERREAQPQHRPVRARFRVLTLMAA